MVYVDDKRKINDLNELTKEAAKSEPQFLYSFPKETVRDHYIFKLILRAYIKARYSKHYDVTEEKLAEITPMVSSFKKLVKKLCQEKIESFV